MLECRRLKDDAQLGTGKVVALQIVGRRQPEVGCHPSGDDPRNWDRVDGDHISAVCCPALRRRGLRGISTPAAKQSNIPDSAKSATRLLCRGSGPAECDTVLLYRHEVVLLRVEPSPVADCALPRNVADR